MENHVSRSSVTVKNMSALAGVGATHIHCSATPFLLWKNLTSTLDCCTHGSAAHLTPTPAPPNNILRIDKKIMSQYPSPDIPNQLPTHFGGFNQSLITHCIGNTHDNSTDYLLITH